MTAKPRVAIVGAGNFGTALALSLRRAGYAIEVILARSRGASLKRAQRLAREVGSRASVGLAAGIRADIFWFCVPDSEIVGAAQILSQNPRTLAKVRAGAHPAKNAARKSRHLHHFEWKGRVALHSSGALTSDELQVLRRRGASVASVHPLMTFVQGSRPSLVGVSFALEGDAAAVQLARRVVLELQGHPYLIRKNDKPAYHAWGTFASPLLTALLATTEQVAAMAGVKRNSARQRMLPILLQTLANYAASGPADGFSGPIVRGDVDTVRKHLRVLRDASPARKVYIALTQAALRYLPAKEKDEFKKILQLL